MMSTVALLTLCSSLLAVVNGHFVLQSPKSLGFNDGLEATGPCGSFDINDRSGAITDYPLGGYPIHVLSTHTRSTFQYRAALANNTESFVNLIPQIGQQGVGDYCLPAVPGVPEWVGLDAVVQVVQFGPDGVLYQCAAVKFVEGGAFTPTSDCKNSTGVAASVTSVTNTLPGQTTLAAGPTGGAGGNSTGSPTTTKPPSSTSSMTAATSSGAATVPTVKEKNEFWGVLLVAFGTWLL